MDATCQQVTVLLYQHKRLRVSCPSSSTIFAAPGPSRLKPLSVPHTEKNTGHIDQSFGRGARISQYTSFPGPGRADHWEYKNPDLSDLGPSLGQCSGETEAHCFYLVFSS